MVLEEETVEDGGLSKDELLAFLSEDEGDDDSDKDDKDDKDKKEDKLESKSEDKDDDKDEEDEEDDEDEDKEEDKDKDDDELVIPFRRKEILAKYPKLYEDFPFLEKAMYRDRQYSEMFSTVDDAKEILEKAETLDEHEKSLMEGDTETILKAIKESDDNTWKKTIDNYLVVLEKIDRNSYLHVIGNVFKNGIMQMAAEGKKSDNKQLQAAAQLLNQYVFGSSEFTSPTNLFNEGSSSERDKLNDERADLLRERFETARDDLDTKINNVLKSVVNDGIDPKNSMTPYVKKQAIRDVMENIQETLSEDANFMKTINNLWKRAEGIKFSASAIKKIRVVYLSKAKTLLPTIVKKARREALKGLGKSTSSEERDTSQDKSTGRIKPSNKKSADGKGMSTQEFFNMD